MFPFLYPLSKTSRFLCAKLTARTFGSEIDTTVRTKMMSNIHPQLIKSPTHPFSSSCPEHVGFSSHLTARVLMVGPGGYRRSHSKVASAPIIFFFLQVSSHILISSSTHPCTGHVHHTQDQDAGSAQNTGNTQGLCRRCRHYRVWSRNLDNFYLSYLPLCLGKWCFVGTSGHSCQHML